MGSVRARRVFRWGRGAGGCGQIKTGPCGVAAARARQPDQITTLLTFDVLRAKAAATRPPNLWHFDVSLSVRAK